MKNKNILLEIDSQQYLIKGKQWQQVEQSEVLNTKGDDGDDLKIISDFGVSPAVRDVHGDSRYAVQFLQRDLRESSELLGGRKVIVHQRQKQDRFNSHLFFSVLEQADLKKLMRKVDESPSGSLPFAFYQSYAKAVQRYAGKGSDAFVFIHNGVVDIVISRGGKLEGFSSKSGMLNASGHSDSFVIALVDLVMTQERISKIKIEQLFLFELLTPMEEDRSWKDNFTKRMGLEIQPVTEQKVSLDGAPYTSSIVPLLNDLSVSDSLLNMTAKIQHQSNRWLVAVAAVLLLLNSFVYWTYEENKQIHQLNEVRVSLLEKKLTAQVPVDKITSVNYKKYLKSVEYILKSNGHKNYLQFINELAEISDVGNRVTYDRVSVDYPDKLLVAGGRLRINLIGHIANGWHTPLNAFDKLAAKFSSKGYMLKDSSIGIVDEGLNFAFVMELSEK